MIRTSIPLVLLFALAASGVARSTPDSLAEIDARLELAKKTLVIVPPKDKAEVMVRIADAYSDKAAYLEAHHDKSAATFRDHAVATYKQTFETQMAYNHLDEVLWKLAHAERAAGKPDDAQQTASKLIRMYYDRPTAARAYLFLADHYCGVDEIKANKALSLAQKRAAELKLPDLAQAAERGCTPVKH